MMTGVGAGTASVQQQHEPHTAGQVWKWGQEWQELVMCVGEHAVANVWVSTSTTV